MENIIKAVRRLWCFIFGNMFVIFFYDRKYLCGEWFKGRIGGIFAPGWEWVYYSGKSRMFRGKNKGVQWPVAESTTVIGGDNITFNPMDLRIFQNQGCYFQALGAEIHIGTGTWIGPGVGIIASNHDINNPDKRMPGESIYIGDHCWIGMNAVILPGVNLGNHTIVGAGAIVTKSFPKGNCVIGGNPAKLIKEL